MDLRSSMILAVAIIVGFMMHALVQPMRPCAPGAQAQPANGTESCAALRSRVDALEDRADVALDEALLHQGAPRILDLGGHTVLYDPTWKRTGSDFTLTPKYYELREGSLVQIPLVPTPER